jgi:hypothetical protein
MGKGSASHKWLLLLLVVVVVAIMQRYPCAAILAVAAAGGRGPISGTLPACGLHELCILQSRHRSKLCSACCSCMGAHLCFALDLGCVIWVAC